ncbi:hypothetical protein OIO90_003990 [Microbotryomycetes sp. JL221]|nr:hypothetical protein OIO90_003990 [Microbotryomycetes sp. JL221]
MSSSTNAEALAAERYLADESPPVCSLNIKTAFEGLSKDERLYAHHMSEASWAGARIVMGQTTFHADKIHDWLMATFSSAQDSHKLADLQTMKQKSGVSDQDWSNVLAFAAQALSNLANFKSFGAVKFIPRVSPEAFDKVVSNAERSATALPLWRSLKQELYAVEPESQMLIGKPSEGHVSSYYPSDPAPSDLEVDEVQRLCDEAGVSTLNTRLSKQSQSLLTLHIASSNKDELPTTYPAALVSSEHNFTVKLVPGDFSQALTKVNDSLTKAIDHAENSNRQSLLKDYIESFKTGDIEKHKQASSKWVKDQGPAVETYIGFIESYVDPFGARAEWEGFVALVNKEQSAKFATLVDKAPELIKVLPWGIDFEVPEFKRPDFTAIEVLSFATSGIPAGINLPNYHDVREKHGYKNVSLSNILSAKAANEIVTFIAPEERQAHDEWADKAFEVQVANHELLGHGTGRLLQENSDGTFNFDRQKLINPLTGKPVESWYRPGETYGAKIGPISSSMEECRAESVALFLVHERPILDIFGYKSDEDAHNLIYWTFMTMARAGIRALEWYDPKTKKHGQAHMEARLGITQWLIQHGIVTLEEIKSDSGELVDAYARVDRQACLDRGKEVMGKLLLEIQVRKSTGDGKGATEFYKKLTAPSEHWVNNLRPVVLAKKLPRKVFVQPRTIIVDGDVQLKEYPASVEGVIESFVERGL